MRLDEADAYVNDLTMKQAVIIERHRSAEMVRDYVRGINPQALGEILDLLQLADNIESGE